MIPLQIEQKVTASNPDRIEAMLYASMTNEQVAALDFSRSCQGICINMVFVKPDFRRRGIAAALMRHLTELYPDMKITCASRLRLAMPCCPSTVHAAFPGIGSRLRP